MFFDCWIFALVVRPAGRPSALAVVQRIMKGDQRTYSLRHLEPFPPGTAYKTIADRLRAAVRSRSIVTHPFAHIRDDAVRILAEIDWRRIAIDVTHIGRDAVNVLRSACPDISFWQFAVTNGLDSVGSDDIVSIPQKDLVSAHQVVLQSRRMAVSIAQDVAERYARQLKEFESLRSGSSEDRRDELVMAVSLALRFGEGDPGIPVLPSIFCNGPRKGGMSGLLRRMDEEMSLDD